MSKLVLAKLPQPRDHCPPRQLVLPAATFRLRFTAVISGAWQTFLPMAGLSRSDWRYAAFDAGSDSARPKSLVNGSAKTLRDHLGGERHGLKIWRGISAWHLAVVPDKTLPVVFCCRAREPIRPQTAAGRVCRVGARGYGYGWSPGRSGGWSMAFMSASLSGRCKHCPCLAISASFSTGIAASLSNAGTLMGGTGGAGGTDKLGNGAGGAGGAGGDGVSLGSASTLSNTNVIIGGTGGAPLNGNGSTAGGAGGAGAYLNAVLLSNSGTVDGGSGGVPFGAQARWPGRQRGRRHRRHVEQHRHADRRHWRRWRYR